MTIHTMSTKCQYRPTSSTTSALSPGTLLRVMMPDERHQHDDADGDVHAVEAGEGVEAEPNRLVVKPRPSW